MNRTTEVQAETPCHAGPTDDADGASSDSRHRSRTHDTEGPIAGIPENESGNDLDRLCSLIEDRLIRSEWLEPLSFIARPVCNTSGSRIAKGTDPIETPAIKDVDFKWHHWRKHCSGLYQTPTAG